jgi:hypothetical protein
VGRGRNHRETLREFSAHISLLAAGHIGSEAVVEYRGRRETMPIPDRSLGPRHASTNLPSPSLILNQGRRHIASRE